AAATRSGTTCTRAPISGRGSTSRRADAAPDAELRPEVRSAEGRSNDMKARVAAATLGVAVLLVVGLSLSRRVSLASRLPARVSHDDAAASGRFGRRSFTDGGVAYQYQVFFPEDYEPKLPWPVIVALHGSAEKGDDGEKQVHVGLANVVRERVHDFPAIV